MHRKWKRSKESVCKWTKNKAGPFKTSKMTISDSFPINKSHQGPSQRLPTQTLRTLGYFDPLTLGQLVPIHRSTMHCVNQNGLRTLPNIKTDHSRQLSLQPKPSGSLPGASDQVWENLRFLSFLECGNRLFNMLSDFLGINEIFKLFWSVSGSDLAT